MSETETEFKLRRFVRTVFESGAVTDPESLAKEVLVQLDPADERAALEQALRLVAQNFLTHARGSLTSSGGHQWIDTREGHVAGGRPSTKSWKTRASREFWRKRLEDLVHVNGPDGQWIALGDCDATALLRIAEHRDMLSAANAREAAGAREWAALLEQHGAATVRKLPESVLRARLQGEVAA